MKPGPQHLFHKWFSLTIVLDGIRRLVGHIVVSGLMCKKVVQSFGIDVDLL